MYIIFGKMSRGEWKIKKKLLFTRCANGYSTMFKKIWVEEFHEIWYSVFAAEPPAERR
jgi:hypothetical protein